MWLLIGYWVPQKQFWTDHALIINCNRFEHIRQKWKAFVQTWKMTLQGPQDWEPQCGRWDTEERRDIEDQRRRTTHPTASQAPPACHHYHHRRRHHHDHCQRHHHHHHIVQHVKLILQLHLDIILVCFVRFIDFVLFVSWIQKSRQIPEGGKQEQEFFGLKKTSIETDSTPHVHKKTKTGVFLNFGKLDLKQVASPDTVVNEVRSSISNSLGHIDVEDRGFQKGEGTCLDFHFLSSVAGEFDHIIVCCVFEHRIALSLI